MFRVSEFGSLLLRVWGDQKCIMALLPAIKIKIEEFLALVRCEDTGNSTIPVFSKMGSSRK